MAKQINFMLKPSATDPTHIIKMIFVKDDSSWVNLIISKQMWRERILFWLVQRYVRGLENEI